MSIGDFFFLYANQLKMVIAVYDITKAIYQYTLPPRDSILPLTRDSILPLTRNQIILFHLLTKFLTVPSLRTICNVLHFFGSILEPTLKIHRILSNSISISFCLRRSSDAFGRLWSLRWFAGRWLLVIPSTGFFFSFFFQFIEVLPFLWIIFHFICTKQK